MDNECFELCKEVYKRTGWKTGDYMKGYPIKYTSDYLLEKLPPTSVARGVAFSVATRIAATYEQLIGAEGDTPLKALLKLTIALSEVGELK